MIKNNLIDGIIKEPLGGAHTFPQQCYSNVKKSIKDNMKEFDQINISDLISKRMEKFSKMGVYKE